MATQPTSSEMQTGRSYHQRTKNHLYQPWASHTSKGWTKTSNESPEISTSEQCSPHKEPSDSRWPEWKTNFLTHWRPTWCTGSQQLWKGIHQGNPENLQHKDQATSTALLATSTTLKNLQLRNMALAVVTELTGTQWRLWTLPRRRWNYWWKKRFTFNEHPRTKSRQWLAISRVLECNTQGRYDVIKRHSSPGAERRRRSSSHGDGLLTVYI